MGNYCSHTFFFTLALGPSLLSYPRVVVGFFFFFKENKPKKNPSVNYPLACKGEEPPICQDRAHILCMSLSPWEERRALALQWS